MPLVRFVSRPKSGEPGFWRRPMVPAAFFGHGAIWRTGRGSKKAYWVCTFNAFDGTAMWAYLTPEQNKELYGG